MRLSLCFQKVTSVFWTKDRLELTTVTAEMCARKLCPLASLSNRSSQILAAEGKNHYLAYNYVDWKISLDSSRQLFWSFHSEYISNRNSDLTCLEPGVFFTVFLPAVSLLVPQIRSATLFINQMKALLFCHFSSKNLQQLLFPARSI